MATAPYAVSSSPDRDEQMTLADGRQVGVAIWGDDGDRTVALCHGNPGSRLICPDLATTIDAGVRLIAVDRPGVGRSDPHPGYTLRDAASDVVEVLGAFHLDACEVVGWSAGGHQALALGAFHPEVVTHVVVAGAPGVPDDPATLAARSAAMEQVRAAVREGSEEDLAAVASRFQEMVDDPEMLLRRTLADDTDPDRLLAEDAAVARFLVAMWAEGVRQGPSGLAAMWAAQYAFPWGFVPEDLEVPVTIWHGRQDRVCPVEHAEHLAERIPDVQLRVLDRAGHLLPIEHWDAILAPR